MFMNERRLAEHQPFRELDRRDAMNRVPAGGCGGPGSEGDVSAGQVAEEVVDFLVAAQAIGKTCPAWTLRRRAEHRAEQRLQAAGPYQHPRHAGRDMPQIDLGVPLVQVVVAEDDGDCGGAQVFGDRHA